MSSPYPATTSAERLALHAAPDAPERMTVVFATYQSTAVIEAAQRDHGLPAFDLAIADEAHRTAGALIPGEDPSPFVRIHDNDAIHAHRRLYMTATPKVYAASAAGITEKTSRPNPAGPCRVTHARKSLFRWKPLSRNTQSHVRCGSQDGSSSPVIGPC